MRFTTYHVFLIIREPWYWYQQPRSDTKKCQIAVCSSVAYGTHWDLHWQPDTTGVVITPLQQIQIDNRGQPACWSLMGLGWGCPIDWTRTDPRPANGSGFTGVTRTLTLSTCERSFGHFTSSRCYDNNIVNFANMNSPKNLGRDPESRSEVDLRRKITIAWNWRLKNKYDGNRSCRK